MYARSYLLVGIVILSLTLSLLSLGATPRPVSAQPTGSTSLISYAPGRLPTAATPPQTYALSWAASDPSISADGSRIAFATNLSLVITDTNGITDIYLYDRTTHQNILASPTYAGTMAAGIDSMTTADIARISPNGRYVTFASSSRLLAAGDSVYSDIFLFNSQDRKVQLVSPATSDGASIQPDVADDGTMVFVSSATNLVNGDTNGKADIFLKKLDGTIERVSVASDGAEANNTSSTPAISRDGTWVAFTSFASDLVAGDSNGLSDIFVRDVVNRETILVSVDGSGGQGNGASRLPDIAVNGNQLRVIFQSSASNLVADDSNGVDDVFVYTRDIMARTSGTRRASVANDGAQGDKAAGGPSVYYWPSITSDGRFVVFPSLATNLVTGDTNERADLFIRDIDGGSTERVSVGADGAQPGSSYGTAADGGQLIAFHASGSLSPMAKLLQMAVFLRDRQGVFTPPSVAISQLNPTTVVQLPNNKVLLAGSAIWQPRISLPSDKPGGYAWFSDRDGVISQAASASIPATSLSLGIHQITFVAMDQDGHAQFTSPRQLVVEPPDSQAIKTLIITNMQRMRQIYSGAAVTSLEALLPTLANHAAVRGQVLDLSADTATADAYAAWIASPTTANANEVVERIKAQIDGFWRSHNLLRYLVIVGDDRVIPFRRVPDQLPAVMHKNGDPWPEEQDYANMVQFPATTSIGAALRDNQILTDDYYGYNARRYSQGYELVPPYYVPELGTGRLVEDPADIQHQINTFLSASSVTVQRTAVTAWGLTSATDSSGNPVPRVEMLADGGLSACQILAQDGINTDCDLVGTLVDSATYSSRMLASGVRNEILAFHHHANHTAFEPKEGDGVSVNTFSSAGADLSRAMLLSSGCHIGLSVPLDNPYASDLAEIITGRDALYLGSTGYGISCTTCMGWTEQLLDNFTSALVNGASTTPGEALVAAKANYQRHAFYPASATGDRESDAKASLQLVLYGLPMYSYVTPSGATVASADDGVEITMTRATLAGGLTLNGFTYQFPPLEEVVTSSGRYYTLQGNAVAGQAQPMQPRYTADLTFPGTRAHGIVFRGGSYSNLANFDPVVAAMVNEYVSVNEPGISGASWRPSLPARLNSLQDVSSMVAALGQYQPSTQTERIYEKLALDIYYHPDSIDWEAPQITALRSTRSGNTTNITIHATDPSDIAAVVIAYTTGDGLWESVALSSAAGAWAGTIPTSDSTRFFVQAVDGAGNVAALDNAGEYYAATVTIDVRQHTYLPYVAR